MFGEVKNGSDAKILGRVPPLEKLARKAALESAASLNKLDGSVGARLLNEVRKELRKGGLDERKPTRKPGRVSMKMPNPPLKTVLFKREGAQTNPNRGCQVSFENLGRARCNPIWIA
jgi:hypothetical protein